MDSEQEGLNEKSDSEDFKKPEWMVILTKLIEKKPEILKYQ